MNYEILYFDLAGVSGAHIKYKDILYISLKIPQGLELFANYKQITKNK
jgi:hypothetical protein